MRSPHATTKIPRATTKTQRSPQKKTIAGNELRAHGLQAWDQGRDGCLREELSSPGTDQGRFRRESLEGGLVLA